MPHSSRIMLAEPTAGMLNYYTVHSKPKPALLAPGITLLKRIGADIRVAEAKEETPANFHVQQIYDALYKTMTMEEVRPEFAGVFVPPHPR